MQQSVGESATGFQGMAEGVAQVEQRALTRLTLIARDNACLPATTDCNRVLACRPAFKYILPVPLEPGEKCRVGQQAIFRNFSVAARKSRLCHVSSKAVLPNTQ